MNVTAILCVADNVSDFMEDCAEALETVFDCSRSVPGKLSLGVNLKLLMTKRHEEHAIGVEDGSIRAFVFHGRKS